MFVGREQLVKLPITRQSAPVLVATPETHSLVAGGLRRKTCAPRTPADLGPTASQALTGLGLIGQSAPALLAGGGILSSAAREASASTTVSARSTGLAMITTAALPVIRRVDRMLSARQGTTVRSALVPLVMSGIPSLLADRPVALRPMWSASPDSVEASTHTSFSSQRTNHSKTHCLVLPTDELNCVDEGHNASCAWSTRDTRHCFRICRIFK